MSFKVKPAREGLIVLDPANYMPLPAEGAEVPQTTYWKRRLRAGDVVPVESVKAAAARPSRSSSTQE